VRSRVFPPLLAIGRFKFCFVASLLVGCGSLLLFSLTVQPCTKLFLSA
jgi:hypothetical protein